MGKRLGKAKAPGGGFGGWKGGLWGLLVLVEGFILDKYLPVLAGSPVLGGLLLGGFFWFWFITFFKAIGSGSVSNLFIYLFKIWDWDLVLVFFGLGMVLVSVLFLFIFK